MKIILIGFMGCGKTSIAKELSPLLRLPILEMDDLVLQKTNTKNMHEVFAVGGELLLRETEIALAKEHAATDDQIISTGAGVVLNKIILDHLKKPDAKIYFLKASFQTIGMRLANDTSRPLFKNMAEAEALYHFRQPLYVQYADLVVEVDEKSVPEIAYEIAENSLRG